MMRPILLGMNPNDSSYEDLDPSVGSGKRILEMVGADVFFAFERRNVLRHEHWRRYEARAQRAQMRHDLSGRIVVALGNEVWSALALPKARWFDCAHTWNGSDPLVKTQTEWWRVPHPSGRSLVYNDEKKRDMLRELLVRLAS